MAANQTATSAPHTQKKNKKNIAYLPKMYNFARK